MNRSTFYVWYRRYTERGRAGLAPQPSAARRYWNRIPPRVRQRVVDAALADPERVQFRNPSPPCRDDESATVAGQPEEIAVD